MAQLTNFIRKTIARSLLTVSKNSKWIKKFTIESYIIPLGKKNTPLYYVWLPSPDIKISRFIFFTAHISVSVQHFYYQVIVYVVNRLAFIYSPISQWTFGLFLLFESRIKLLQISFLCDWTSFLWQPFYF